tara:strand:- start:897 stop:1148 length:252 start_codon:yes stop_codon:yes gene_type:complete
LICFSIFFINHHENNSYIIEPLELYRSVMERDALFKVNCVGCYGITARGLVVPGLHSLTHRLNDRDNKTSYKWPYSYYYYAKF